MTYVIGEACVDVLDRTCVDECPVDCIYEGERMLYIHPDECVDCGACEPVCPVEAIYYEDDLPEEWQGYTGENVRFFTETLPGRDEPLGSPGGAARLGPVGVDTPFVASLPPRAE
jgi:NAD-dependent dihydropyrimidine dehydrogenase PreA subunit